MAKWKVEYFLDGDLRTMIIEQPDYYSGQDAMDEMHRKTGHKAHGRSVTKL